jgi:hypothetical protein
MQPDKRKVNMCLPQLEVDQFYKIWKPLLFFANERYHLISEWKNKTMDTKLRTEDVVKVRDRIWQDKDLLNQFVNQNPANYSKQDLDQVINWKYRRSGDFFIFKSFKKHAIFIAQDNSRDVFAVKGLYSPISEIFPYLPILVKAVLLPHGNEIISDGLYQIYNVSFGSGIIEDYKTIYDDARERGKIISSLLPPSEPVTPQELIKKAEATNKKVLADFEKYLLRTGSSLKIIERDLTTIRLLATESLGHTAKPLSLRDLTDKELTTFLDNLPANARHSSVIGLKRFVHFALDTGRIEWDSAENMLLVL